MTDSRVKTFKANRSVVQPIKNDRFRDAVSSRDVGSKFESPKSGFWPGIVVEVAVSLLNETPTPGPVCFIWTCA